jgi:hypothetical protein
MAKTDKSDETDLLQEGAEAGTSADLAPAATETLTPAPDVASTADEFDGLGGSYVADPETGKRTRVEQTQPANNQPEKG